MTLLEARLVTFDRFGSAGVDQLALWLASFSPEIVAFDEGQADTAFKAFQSYGKGVHPKAKLNMGDCASYALAKSQNAPLLFKGLDFAATDLVPALT